jgi:hypothetical protein
MNGIPAGPIAAGRITLESGQAIKTGEGMAELLLTPGSFLRLGDHSELTLEAAGTSEIRVRLRTGESLLELLDLHAPIVLEQNGVTIVVRKPGLYDFDDKRGLTMIYDGEAQLSRNNKRIVARKGFAVRARSLREFPANRDPGSPLFSWSSLRSEQLSSESEASSLAYPGGAGKQHGSAWYWNPWSASYTWISSSGVVTGPFGWSYYSPGYVPNYLPVLGGGDSYSHSSPVAPGLGPMQPADPARPGAVPAVPLTAPGVPQFPNNRF